ncbi:tumor necrosis factor ligand superfamily member 14-like [Seriola aureovittata]|uniref:tumor necrosis factor ligand superfamily member 14-like n=1 Tax=Seriola aureovittata TaxID=2871759 RepID=UPI0024BD99EF|nr:tumor necrosis factor ligand superfamily member 14-like [Seriola aureovittata]
MSPAEVTEEKFLSVHVVESRPGLGQWRVGGAQTLLFLMVSVALCGMAVEACFIYRLYRAESATSASPSKLMAGQEVPPSKPVAHLTDGTDAVHGQQIMAWSMITDPLLYGMNYKNNRLIIQTEGYYYVYSKVFFLDNGVFHHSVSMETQKYTGGSLTLLQSRKYSPGTHQSRSNSYLGGVFRLNADDALYVTVSNTTKIERHGGSENIFGAFMI